MWTAERCPYCTRRFWSWIALAHHILRTHELRQ